jgi:hypothetical protein
MRALALAAVLVSFTALAGDLTPEEVAKIRMEKKAATDAVEKKYAGKKLSSAERKEMEKEKNEAAQKVFDKAGVDAKGFARAETKMGREDSAAADAAQKGMEKKKEEDAKAAEAKKKDEGKGKEIVIEKGKGKGKGGAGMEGGPPAGTPEGDAAEAAAADREAGLKK